MNRYENIVFDVGGVLLSYRWFDAITEAGCTPEEARELGPKLFEDPCWRELDLGIRPYFEVVNEFAAKYPEYTSVITEFLTEVKRMPIGRPAVWEEVHRLKEKGYKLYILSNYSEYMIKNHTENLPFVQDMDGGIVSYMVHVNKPDKGIYEALFKKYDLNPSECLFFDDREENIEGAKKCGMDGIVVTSEEFLVEELKKL